MPNDPSLNPADGTPTDEPTDSLSTALDQEQLALLHAIDSLLGPLADLCLSRGLTIQSIEERLRRAMVQAAIKAHNSTASQPGDAAPARTQTRTPIRIISRISASTGLTRREVTRLQTPSTRPAAHQHRPSTATEVFTRWMTEPALRTPQGEPRALPRLGPAPSFEQLAQSVTQDVHPRSLLDELVRLHLVAWNLETDQVQLLHDAFVPRGDWARMTAFLADNVGDHLRSATANVMGTGREHLEQAIFADELSSQSLAQFKNLMTAQWRHLLDTLPQQLSQMIDADKAAGRPQDQRVRVGLYTWAQPMAPLNEPPLDAPGKPPKARAKGAVPRPSKGAAPRMSKGAAPRTSKGAAPRPSSIRKP